MDNRTRYQRKFGNSVYMWSGAYSSRTEALKRAKELRGIGFNARVAKRTALSIGNGSVYDVYRKVSKG